LTARSAGEAHVPVMRDEVLEALALKLDGRYLDGTFGRGGHAAAMLERLGANARLLLMDKDLEAIAVAEAWAARDPRIAVRHGSYAGMAEWDEARTGLDGVLLDLGVSSPQLDQPERGFSFSADGPLDMRMDRSRGPSAAEWLARANERELADALYEFGEERQSRRVARAIVSRQSQSPITRTRELAEVCERALGFRERGKHPATRTFQALRIVVNRELEELEQGLDAAVECLKTGARLVVLSFHSLEDRIVKRRIQGERPKVRRGLPPPEVAPPRLRAVARSRRPTSAECARNPRSRSATLRVAEKLR